MKLKKLLALSLSMIMSPGILERCGSHRASASDDGKIKVDII